MTLQVNIPDSLLRQTAELAERQHVTVDQVIAAALAAQVSQGEIHQKPELTCFMAGREGHG